SRIHGIIGGINGPSSFGTKNVIGFFFPIICLRVCGFFSTSLRSESRLGVFFFSREAFPALTIAWIVSRFFSTFFTFDVRCPGGGLFCRDVWAEISVSERLISSIFL